MGSLSSPIESPYLLMDGRGSFRSQPPAAVAAAAAAAAAAAVAVVSGGNHLPELDSAALHPTKDLYDDSPWMGGYGVPRSGNILGPPNNSLSSLISERNPGSSSPRTLLNVIEEKYEKHHHPYVGRHPPP